MNNDRDELPRNDDAKTQMVWMLSFADLLSLLLAFFVMLYAMTQSNTPALKEAAQSLQQRLNPAHAQRFFTLSPEDAVPQEPSTRALDLHYLLPIVRAKIAASPDLSRVQARPYSDRVVLTLPGDTLFAPSEAVMTDTAKAMIVALGEMLNSIDNRVEIIGHAEPGKPSDSIYATGWELSLARAAAVARELRISGYEQDVDITGFSDARYTDLDAALPEEQRRAQSRRVDIVLREQRRD